MKCDADTTLPRILFAGTGSGCGKTSAVCAVLGALRMRGESPRAFKCGPDYIDPMFHREVLEIPSHNLDLFLCGEAGVKTLLSRHILPGCVGVLEGAMGFYDGVSWTGEASAWELSQLTGTPVVLVVSARGKALSLAAQVKGYLNFAPNNIRGVLLNGATERTYPMYRRLLREHCGVEALGYLPHIREAELQSRYLGLVTAGEIALLREKMERLARAALDTVNLDRLLELAEEAAPLPRADARMQTERRSVRVGVACDEAFCFTYQDNLDVLQELGAEIIPFSPLKDRALPENIHGLLLGGGYPELYARQLADNTEMLADLRRQIAGGVPTVAECGGFMLLCRVLRTVDGTEYPMAGVLEDSVEMTRRLGRFGYLTLTAQKDNLLCRRGEMLRAHEFHYSRARSGGDGMQAQKPGREERWDCVYAGNTLWAGYPHLHLRGAMGSAERFVSCCRHYGEIV